VLDIYVDADACPVKPEVCRVAARYSLNVTFVANSQMRLPGPGSPRLVVVSGRFDAADDWVVEHAAENDIVVTADIPLASRCIETGASVLRPTGKPFTPENIGDVLATRNLLAELRGAGEITGGPPPFDKKDRSRFLQSLDQIIQKLKRHQKIG
jgi:uncharacterized protein YaiI (UPF0178 family)